MLLTRRSSRAQTVMEAHPSGRALGTTVTWRSAAPRPEQVVVAVAGTADLPVADECEAVLDALGFSPRRLADVGVAGLHRLLAHHEELACADAVVVIAGMEGTRQRGRRAGAGARYRGAHERRLRRVVRRHHGVARHFAAARRGSRSSASTTASAPPARWPACATSAAERDRRSAGGNDGVGARLRRCRRRHAARRAPSTRVPISAGARGDRRASPCLAGRSPPSRPRGRSVRDPCRRRCSGASLAAAHLAGDRRAAERGRAAGAVRERARATFGCLAAVEGRLHGIAPEDVHFHEVGALDAIVDVVGVAAALESLAVERLVAGPIHVGTGTVLLRRAPQPGAGHDRASPPPGCRSSASRSTRSLTTPTGQRCSAHSPTAPARCPRCVPAPSATAPAPASSPIRRTSSRS